MSWLIALSLCLLLGFGFHVFWPASSFQGDINKKGKSNKKLEKQIKKMATGCDKVDVRHREDLASLEEEVQKINANIQVGPRPLITPVIFISSELNLGH